jgi:hypothetical protein
VEATEPLRSICLFNCSVEPQPQDVFAFVVDMHDDGRGASVVETLKKKTKPFVFSLRARSQVEREEWIRALRSVCARYRPEPPPPPLSVVPQA